MSGLRALMVDVDGVVVVPPPGGWAATLEADLGLPLAVLQEHLFTAHWPDVILGRADLKDRVADVLARHAPHLSADRLIAYWFEKDAILDHVLLEDLAAQRERGLQLHLATVQEHLRADYLWTALRLRDRFDAMHYSADVGARKPELAFFEAVAERTGFRPAEMLLIDDNAENVEAARAAGWSGVLWTRRERLAEVLPQL
jgi:putative hydrolase of the HAD superfamily